LSLKDYAKNLFLIARYGIARLGVLNLFRY